MQTDEELLQAWRAGDQAAGRMLFEKYVGLVSRFFRNKVGDEREDLIQRTFLSCVEARDQVRDGRRFRAYLLRVARSRLYDHYIVARGGPKRPDPLAVSVADTGMSPSRVLAKDEQDNLLLHALRRLPMDLQLVLELHYWEGISTAELSEVLEIPQGTVKTRLFRARKLLREDLARLAAEGRLPEASVLNLDAWAHGLRDAMLDGPADTP